MQQVRGTQPPSKTQWRDERPPTTFMHVYVYMCPRVYISFLPYPPVCVPILLEDRSGGPACLEPRLGCIPFAYVGRECSKRAPHVGLHVTGRLVRNLDARLQDGFWHNLRLPHNKTQQVRLATVVYKCNSHALAICDTCNFPTDSIFMMVA